VASIFPVSVRRREGIEREARLRSRPDGNGVAGLHLPPTTRIIGLRVHTAFVRIDQGAPSSIESLAKTWSFTITKSGAKPALDDRHEHRTARHSPLRLSNKR